MSPKQIVRDKFKSSYQREYERDSIESASMEIDYKDFLSSDIDEGIDVQAPEMLIKQSILNTPSSLSSNNSRFSALGASKKYPEEEKNMPRPKLKSDDLYR